MDTQVHFNHSSPWVRSEPEQSKVFLAQVDAMDNAKAFAQLILHGKHRFRADAGNANAPGLALCRHVPLTRVLTLALGVRRVAATRVNVAALREDSPVKSDGLLRAGIGHEIHFEARSIARLGRVGAENLVS